MIEHFSVSKSIYDDVNQITIIDSGINLSDHCPIIMDISIPISSVLSCETSINCNKDQINFRWDKGDISMYYDLTRDLLSDICIPSFLMGNSNANNMSTAEVLSYINVYYKNIVDAIFTASCTAIPRKDAISTNFGGMKNSLC